MTDLLRLVRVQNLLIAVGGVLAGGWIGQGRIGVPIVLFWAALSGAGLGAAGNALNDLLDVTADRHNRPDRPVAAGHISRGTAWLVVIASALIGLAAAAFVSALQVLVALGAFAVMAIYSPWLKRRGVPGNVAVALVAGLPLFYGALAVSQPEAGVVPWALAAWLHLVREIVKDLEDEAGDRLLERRTLPITVGRRRAAITAAVLALGFVPLSLVLPLEQGYRAAYWVVALPAQLGVIAAAVHLVLDHIERVSRLLKAVMVVGLVALIAGRTM
jgi:geranylgeranylglycerol-phosphate geranylgeranyltransferase